MKLVRVDEVGRESMRLVGVDEVGRGRWGRSESTSRLSVLHGSRNVDSDRNGPTDRMGRDVSSDTTERHRMCPPGFPRSTLRDGSTLREWEGHIDESLYRDEGRILSGPSVVRSVNQCDGEHKSG